MFVLKSAHEALLIEKNERIKQLQDEVAFLRKMVQPSFRDSFKITTEASAILEGRQEPIDVSEDEVQSEASRLLSGTY
jgi:hypothetical protein